MKSLLNLLVLALEDTTLFGPLLKLIIVYVSIVITCLLVCNILLMILNKFKAEGRFYDLIQDGSRWQGAILLPFILFMWSIPVTILFYVLVLRFMWLD